MEAQEGTVCLPGDALGHVPKGESGAELRIGPELAQGGEERIVATRAGVLCYKARHKYWYVDSSRAHPQQRRYVPALEDLVVGVVTGRVPGQGSDAVLVDVGAAALATLSLYAFEGATKHNRPRLPTGSVVYARVVSAGRDIDPELECLSIRKRADGFGELVGGTVFRVSIAQARALLEPTCPVLCALGALVPYEIAVGLNGRVWIKAQCVTLNVPVVVIWVDSSIHINTVCCCYSLPSPRFLGCVCV